MTPTQRITAILAGTFLLGACQQQVADPQPNFLGSATVAEVNGTPVYESIFRIYSISMVQKPVEELSAQEREAVLNAVVQLYLLAGKAEAEAMHEERSVAAQLELQRLNALARTAVNRYREDNEATELELREAYEESLDELGATQFKARHILVNTQPEATAIIEELKGGADFAELAKERSTGPTGPNGGDLGWFDANTMVPPFANAVKAMTAGTFSEEPVETRFGWHVILLEDVRENEPPGLDAVRDQIKNRVEQRKIEAYVASLREAASVVLGDSVEPVTSEAE